MSTAEHIAFLCPRFADGPTVGGAETLLRELAKQAQAAGRKVTFLTTCARNHFTWQNDLPPGQRKIDGLDVHFFPVDENRDITAFLKAQQVISRKGVYSAEDEMTWLSNSVNSSALYRHLREDGQAYDRIVMGPYLFGLVYFASQIHPQKTLLVPCLHDEGFAYIRAFQKMFQSVAGIMFNSEPERDLARRLYDLQENKCAVVGMGFEPFDASPDAFSKKKHLRKPYVIYCGRREPAKGLPLLYDYLNVFRRRTRQDVKLVLTGTGEVDAPAELMPHILDLGFVSEEEMHEAGAGAVAFCHPSIYESLSVVLMEAWLARIPALVHARCEVTRYHCQRSNGGLWFRMYPEFEEELSCLLRNSALRRAMGESGRNYVLREYAWPSISGKLLNALDKLPF